MITRLDAVGRGATFTWIFRINAIYIRFIAHLSEYLASCVFIGETTEWNLNGGRISLEYFGRPTLGTILLRVRTNYEPKNNADFVVKINFFDSRIK